jgi:hypothetical protein
MQLGVNFCHDPRQPIGFNADAVRALRPPVVRATARDPENLGAWLDSAELNHLSVLWTIPIERIGLRRALYVARMIRSLAWRFTAGVEIGFAPWAWSACKPAEYLHQALEIAGLLDCPVLLGLDPDRSIRGRAWFHTFMAEAGRLPPDHLRRHFAAWSTSATRPGRPIGRFRFRVLQADLMARLGLPIAFTRVGWQIGEPLSLWRGIVENFRASVQTIGEPHDHVVDVTPTIRARWLLEAYSFAEELRATHFIVEAERMRPSLGVNRWSLYDGESGRPDQAWTSLLWRQAYPLRPATDAYVDARR